MLRHALPQGLKPFTRRLRSGLCECAVLSLGHGEKLRVMLRLYPHQRGQRCKMLTPALRHLLNKIVVVRRDKRLHFFVGPQHTVIRAS